MKDLKTFTIEELEAMSFIGYGEDDASLCVEGKLDLAEEYYYDGEEDEPIYEPVETTYVSLETFKLMDKHCYVERPFFGAEGIAEVDNLVVVLEDGKELVPYFDDLDLKVDM